MKNIFCTISSRNYLAYTLTLYQSFREQGGGGPFYILIVDRKTDDLLYLDEGIVFVYVEDLQINNFEELAFVYDIVELNTSVKPTFIKYIMRKCGPETVTYVDPDCCFFGDPAGIISEHKAASILLTPHALTAHKLSDLPGERMYLKIGNCNLGFVSLRNDQSSQEFLDWWEERCLSCCFTEPYTGIFVDQKWCNLVPMIFSNVSYCGSFGVNMGNWNLHERFLQRADRGWCVNNKDKLIFYHFSGFILNDSALVSKHTGNLSLSMREDLRDIYDIYRSKVLSLSGREKCVAYSYGAFSNGKEIPALARKLYLGSPHRESTESPFDANSSFYGYLKLRRLLGSSPRKESDTANSVERGDRRLQVLHFVLRCFSWVIGGGRYAIFIKYMAYISMPRNQGYVFFGRRNAENKSIEF